MGRMILRVTALTLAATLIGLTAWAAVDGEAFRAMFQPVGGRYESSPSTISDGQQDELRLTSAGLLRVQIEGTGAASLGKAEDAAHASGDTGVMSLSVRKDTAAALAGTDADYQPLITDASGRLHVNVGTIVPGVAATSLGKAEDAAHATGDTGVVGLAVRSDTAVSLAGAAGDYIPLIVDASGRLWVNASHPVAATADVNATLAADVDGAVAAAAGLRLMGWAAYETTGAAVASLIIVEGATGAGGTALIPVTLAANESRADWYGPGGIACASGLSIDYLAGTPTIVLYYATQP